MTNKPAELTATSDMVAYKIVDRNMTCALDGYMHAKDGYSLPVHEPGKTIRADVECFGSMAMAIDFSHLANGSIPLRCIVPKGSAISMGGKECVCQRARIATNCLYVDKMLSWEEAFDLLATEESEWFIYGASEIPSVEYNYPGVKTLSFMGSDITSLPKGISGLTGLLTLNLGSTDVEEIPKAVYSLASLEDLDMSGTRIQDVSNDIARLENLQYLDLSETPIESLPGEIFKMKSLRSLNLSRCSNLHRLPRLPRLDELFLDSVVLESIDDELLDQRYCSNLSLWGATIKSLTDKQMEMMMSENCGAHDYWRADKLAKQAAAGGNQNGN